MLTVKNGYMTVKIAKYGLKTVKNGRSNCSVTVKEKSKLLNIPTYLLKWLL
jgi:hypothetical protein